MQSNIWILGKKAVKNRPLRSVCSARPSAAQAPRATTTHETIPMLVLCGFAISNYYNKVKLALLEKNVPFTEEMVHPKNADAAVFAMSPLGKIPYIRTPQGALCESQAIMEYVEAAYPGTKLVPADPFAASSCKLLSSKTNFPVGSVSAGIFFTKFQQG